MRVAALAMLVAAAATAAWAEPATAPPDEADLKAAFIYNFTKFVEWPGAGSAPPPTFDITVVGAPEVAAALAKAVAGKTAQAQPIVVHSVADSAAVAALVPRTKILFIGSAAADSLRRWRAATRGHPVLTVGDSEEFWQQGGTIGFLVQDNRMRFRVNLAAAERDSLKINSRLLVLATEVSRGTTR